jgi:hypothetical protein
VEYLHCSLKCLFVLLCRRGAEAALKRDVVAAVQRKISQLPSKIVLFQAERLAYKVEHICTSSLSLPQYCHVTTQRHILLYKIIQFNFLSSSLHLKFGTLEEHMFLFGFHCLDHLSQISAYLWT